MAGASLARMQPRRPCRRRSATASGWATQTSILTTHPTSVVRSTVAWATGEDSGAPAPGWKEPGAGLAVGIGLVNKNTAIFNPRVVGCF
jgi:hypothetical protein